MNAIAEYNETPVYIATTKGYVDIVDMLIKHNADVNMFAGDDQENQFTPLQAAIYYISDYKLFKMIVDKLIEGNADLSIDIPGPLIILCVQYSKFDFAKYLISVGADVEQRTMFNQSCFYKGMHLPPSPHPTGCHPFFTCTIILRAHSYWCFHSRFSC